MPLLLPMNNTVIILFANLLKRPIRSGLRTFIQISLTFSLRDIESHIGEEVVLRGRAFNVNNKGKCCFIVLRQHVDTVQCCLFQGGNIPKAMVTYAGKIPKESIIDVHGIVQKVEKQVEATTFKNVEISITKIFVVSRVRVELPFQIDDAMRTDAEIAANEALDENERKFITVNADTRLDYRWVDLRTPCNQAIARLSSAVGLLFRQFLIENEFVEIHSPKIIPGASEGGSNVFKYVMNTDEVVSFIDLIISVMKLVSLNLLSSTSK